MKEPHLDVHVDVRVDRSVWDDVLEEERDEGFVSIHANVVVLRPTERGAKRVKVGSVSAVLIDPYATDIFDDADEDPDLYDVVSMVYQPGGEGEFHPWWAVDMPLGRVLWIRDVEGMQSSRGRRVEGIARLAIRRVLQLFEASMVVMFVRGADTKVTKKLQHYYSEMGFMLPSVQQGALDALAGNELFSEAAKMGVMYLDPALRSPAKGYWKEAQRDP